MNNAITQFRLNMQSVKHLDSVHISIEQQVTSVIDLSEILRAEIILAVSALDCFIHDLIRLRMVDIFVKNENWSNSFLKFSISIECLRNINLSSDINDKIFFLDQEIRRVNGYKSFQEPEKISGAFSTIGVQKLWDKVGQKISLSSIDTINKLNLIVERRNQIAHEADIDPTLGLGNKFPIDRNLVTQTIQFIETICEKIHEVVIESY
jgi:hypothetical protein